MPQCPVTGGSSVPEVQVVNIEGFLEEVIPVPSCEWRVGGNEAGETDWGDEHPRLRFFSLAEFMFLSATMSSLACLSICSCLPPSVQAQSWVPWSPTGTFCGAPGGGS